MKAAVETADGVFEVDLDEEELLDFTAEERLERPTTPKLSLPLVVAVAAVGATVVAIVDRRPPLAVSHDAGRTWRERGGGLPRGVALTIDEDDPDVVLFAARNRLFLSRDGGRFWRALTLELPEILAVEFRA
ncbi:MAG: Sortilin, neurotensin receptor 3 [Gaiellaceae bacterium]|nr:Sortilin, neurotensin receptor 3 [Gaiellaceae bacterium]